MSQSTKIITRDIGLFLRNQKPNTQRKNQHPQGATSWCILLMVPLLFYNATVASTFSHQTPAIEVVPALIRSFSSWFLRTVQFFKVVWAISHRADRKRFGGRLQDAGISNLASSKHAGFLHIHEKGIPAIEWRMDLKCNVQVSKQHRVRQWRQMTPGTDFVGKKSVPVFLGPNFVPGKFVTEEREWLS